MVRKRKNAPDKMLVERMEFSNNVLCFPIPKSQTPIIVNAITSSVTIKTCLLLTSILLDVLVLCIHSQFSFQTFCGYHFLFLEKSRVGLSIAAQAAHGSVREALTSYGSCYLILFNSKLPVVKQCRVFFSNSTVVLHCFSF